MLVGPVDYAAMQQLRRVLASRMESTVSDTATPSTKGGERSPSLAALLSFVWPGLGQLYLRNRRLAAIFALPSVVVVLLLAYALRRGPLPLAAQLFAERTVAVLTIAILILFGVWRLVSVVDAFRRGSATSAHKRIDRAVLVALATIIAVTHLGGGYYLLAYSDAGTEVFDTGNTSLIVQATPGPTPSPGLTAGPTSTPEAAPTPVPNGRVTILLTGRGSGTSYNAYDSI